MNQFVIRYGELLLKRLSKGIRCSKKKGVSKGIHQFRLSAKRLYSLIRLLELLSNEKDVISIVRPYKKIYNRMGKIRDLQIHKQLLKQLKNDSPGEVKSFSKRINKSLKGKMSIINRSFPKSKQCSRLSFDQLVASIARANQSITAQGCNEFIENEFAIIRALVGENIGDQVIHEIRKHLKNIVYTLQLLVEQDPDFKVSENTLSQLNAIQEKLGEWNDWNNLLKSLHRIKGKRSQYQKLILASLREKDRCKRDILLNFSSFNSIK
jgi:CHAD domain-containing protein